MTHPTPHQPQSTPPWADQPYPPFPGTPLPPAPYLQDGVAMLPSLVGAGLHPVRPEPYPQLLRHARRAWWRPVVAFLVFAAAFLLTQLLGGVAMAVIGGVLHPDDPLGWVEATLGPPSNPAGFLATNLMLASLVPATMLALWAGFGVSPRATFSVTGRFRWRWMAWVALFVFPYFALFFAVVWFLDGSPVSARPEHWPVLLALCLLTTPLQCAGEEYGFRVFFLQTVGAWFPQRRLAVLVPVLVSAPLFALAHGSMDGWVLADIGLFALSTMLVAWRTGGVEAPIVMHSANNMLLMLQTILWGGFEDVFVYGETTGSLVSLAVSAVNQALLVGIVFAVAHWKKPARLGDPESFRLSRPKDDRAAQAQLRGGYLPGAPTA